MTTLMLCGVSTVIHLTPAETAFHVRRITRRMGLPDHVVAAAADTARAKSIDGASPNEAIAGGLCHARNLTTETDETE